jgi:hypothetical protein
MGKEGKHSHLKRTKRWWTVIKQTRAFFWEFWTQYSHQSSPQDLGFQKVVQPAVRTWCSKTLNKKTKTKELTVEIGFEACSTADTLSLLKVVENSLRCHKSEGREAKQSGMHRPLQDANLCKVGHLGQIHIRFKFLSPCTCAAVSGVAGTKGQATWS